MQKSTYSEAFAAFEDVARFDVSTCSDIPTIILGHGSAGNDATCDDPALRELDDRTLHDLGFDRSEITSVAAEVSGRAEPARMRALLMSHTLP